ncbi:MAG: DNA mismatch repair endonuclease MutL [Gammaproteobacteria bacterium]|nr:DNA mismatch repair endonuclease MutL [Gammaproteobacteria bacterium]NIR84287.1 DNA mismatch repair endonuclease MutL [Gammaproteobacteria bacterium]NIR89757.1 DNA mismatch repair endonuclease MutL [Gammaproteobacteria bacterium]NIU05445.1 DNA mismatch repair endonuclease MutL [Gammaproteobacteria bacterium]NIV52392.1 DNA mismatch repair endonuclease MutL [Gammaproteobacteria bacterium]
MQTPPPPIVVLPPALASQIAAGEVVERPASVAKELLENSLDAGARRIQIDVEGGGARLIRVRDDGHGMPRDELALALARHATSKVRSLDELVRVRSLGFRGEALPSIAAVSRLTVTSRVHSQETGWRLESTLAGESPSPAAHPVGTTVEVRDLFFNTPARRKFLRTEKTEFRHLEDVVRRIGLSHAEIGLTLRHNRRQVLALRPAAAHSERVRRVGQACGRAFVEQALELDFESTDLRLSGFVASPRLARAQADLQYFFVNGRMVRDSLIRHAVRQACQDLLPQGRHPAYVLYLELEPTQVDVNVHPAKHEVRFRESRLVHDFVFRSLKRALAGPPLLETEPTPSPGHPAPATGEPNTGVNEQVAAYAALHTAPRRTAPAPDEPGAPKERPLGRAVAQLHDRYILAQSARGLVLVDIPAARRWLCFARLREEALSDSLRSQPLLLPSTLSVSEEEAAAFEREGGRLRRLGLDVRRTAPGSVCLRGVPSMLGAADGEALMQTLRSAVRSRQRQAGADAAEEALLWELAACAARSAASQSRGIDELNALLRELESGPGATGTADGIWVELDLPALARLLHQRAERA